MKLNKLLILLILSSLILSIIHAVKYQAVWWDAAVYIGMGKYIYSLGSIGLWEEFRPILWPAILGLFWKAGINPLNAGTAIEIIFSTGTICLVYLIGRKINHNTGIIAATILSFSYAYFILTPVQLTDIPSLFFSLLSIYLALNDKYFTSGLSIGAAFLLRFPQGLTLPVILIFIILNTITNKNYKEQIKNSMKLSSGFFILAVPYMFSNYLTYDSILSPFTKAREVIAYSSKAYPTEIFFYFIELIKNNFLIIFALLGLIIYLFNIKNREKSLDLNFIALVLFTVYFSYEVQRNFRYILSFLPYYCIFAGFGINIFIEKIRIVKPKIIILALILLSSIIYAPVALKSHDVDVDVKNFNEYFSDKPGAIVYGSTPLFAAYSDVRIIPITNWEWAMERYKTLDKVDYIAINTCDLYCGEDKESCTRNKERALKELGKSNLKYNKTVSGCNMLVYKTL